MDYLQGPPSIIQGDRFWCKDCPRSYKHYRNLWRHRRFECGKLPEFQCPYCSKQSHRKSGIFSHILHCHNNNFIREDL